MIQCPDGHIFCKACVLAFSQERLGQRNAALKCMHMSNCPTEFALAQLKECLPDTLLSLYERVKQEEEIAAAGLNFVRIPIGWWAIETRGDEPYLPKVSWKCVICRFHSAYSSSSFIFVQLLLEGRRLGTQVWSSHQSGSACASWIAKWLESLGTYWSD